MDKDSIAKDCKRSNDALVQADEIDQGKLITKDAQNKREEDQEKENHEEEDQDEEDNVINYSWVDKSFKLEHSNSGHENITIKDENSINKGNLKNQGSNQLDTTNNFNQGDEQIQKSRLSYTGENEIFKEQVGDNPNNSKVEDTSQGNNNTIHRAKGHHTVSHLNEEKSKDIIEYKDNHININETHERFTLLHSPDKSKQFAIGMSSIQFEIKKCDKNYLKLNQEDEMGTFLITSNSLSLWGRNEQPPNEVLPTEQALIEVVPTDDHFSKMKVNLTDDIFLTEYDDEQLDNTNEIIKVKCQIKIAEIEGSDETSLF